MAENTTPGTYVPSPAEWVRDQVARYESTGGRDGNLLRGVPIVVITSTGARSGAVRKNPVMRVEHEGSYAAVASKGGAPDHPSWYANLVANPRVQLQDGPEARPYVARIVEGDERAAWWQRAVAVWPDYDEYQAKTDRRIPVFVLDPA